jgi:hypothetical protein
VDTGPGRDTPRRLCEVGAESTMPPGIRAKMMTMNLEGRDSACPRRPTLGSPYHRPPKDGSSYLLMARIGEERPWPGEPGQKLVDITHWMAIPEIPVPE